MKRAFNVLVTCWSLATLAAPTFVTPSMLDRRNGLTDAQYEYLWSIGKNPQISRAAARDWCFRANRYHNVTNWLDICGTSNDFARLSYTLQDANFKLTETNSLLRTVNQKLAQDVQNLMLESATFSNAVVIAEGQLNAATAKIQGEIADLQEKITKYEGYKTKYPLLKTVWAALITDAENRIKILQAVTGAAQ